MKKLYVLILAVLMALPSVAKEPERLPSIPFRHEVRLGWGGYPNTSILPDRYCCCDIEPSYNHSFADLYKGHSGPVYMTGAIAVEYTYHFKKWCSFGGIFSYNGIYADNYDRLTSEKLGRDCGEYLLLMPYVRFNYFSRPYVKLYSSVGLGAGYGSFRNEQELTLACQMALFGVSVGRKVFGFCELGVGFMYNGCMVGVGYRF